MFVILSFSSPSLLSYSQYVIQPNVFSTLQHICDESRSKSDQNTNTARSQSDLNTNTARSKSDQNTNTARSKSDQKPNTARCKPVGSIIKTLLYYLEMPKYKFRLHIVSFQIFKFSNRMSICIE